MHIINFAPNSSIVSLQELHIFFQADLTLKHNVLADYIVMSNTSLKVLRQ